MNFYRIFLPIVSIFLTLSAYAQTPESLPVDPGVKMGTLANGLTYYIVKNEAEKESAGFYLVQKTGTTTEGRGEYGTAKLLSDMAFCGTRNFPSNVISKYFEKLGLTVGDDVKISTNFNETIFEISAVPLTSTGVIDSCLIILYDWASSINLDESDIDVEKPIFIQTEKAKNNAEKRMSRAIASQIMPSTIYAQREKSKDLDAPKLLNSKNIRKYYYKWFRPDLQSIIIVGDVDPTALESQIKSLFASIPRPLKVKEKISETIEDNIEPIIAIASDIEGVSANIDLYFKSKPLPKEFLSSSAFYIQEYLNDIIMGVLKERFESVMKYQKFPIYSYSISNGKFAAAATEEALKVSISVPEDALAESIDFVINLARNIETFGVTSDEYVRVAVAYLRNLERLYKERDFILNRSYAEACIDNFIYGNPLISIELKYAIMSEIAPTISPDQLDLYVKARLSSDKNFIVSCLIPKRDSSIATTSEEVEALVIEAKESEIYPFYGKYFPLNFVDIKSQDSPTVSESKEPITDSKIWHFANGATVVFKKSNSTKDKIIFKAISRGGTSLLTSYSGDNSILEEILTSSGLGEYNSGDLGVLFSKEDFYLRPELSLTQESLFGESNFNSFERLLQLVHLTFTDIRRDEKAYKTLINRYKSQLNITTDFEKIFADSLKYTLYNNLRYNKNLTDEDLDNLNYDKIFNFLSGRFDNAADFYFVIIGNIDEELAKSMAQKYISKLPSSTTKKESWRVVPNYLTKGVHTKLFEQEMLVPTCFVNLTLNSSMRFSLENVILTQMVNKLIKSRIGGWIRSEKIGVGDVKVSSNMEFVPEEIAQLSIFFKTDSLSYRTLLDRIEGELESIGELDISEEEFANLKLFFVKKYNESIKDDTYWADILSQKYIYEKDFHTSFSSLLEGITSQKLKAYISSLLNSGNRIELIMKGVKKDVKRK